MGQGVQEGEVRPRSQPEMGPRVSAQFYPPRVDDDQIGAAQDLFLDPGADDRMVLGYVRAINENGAGALDVVEGVGRRAGAEYHLHGGGGGGVTDPRAAVDVVGSKNGSGEFLREIIFFVS